MLLRDTIGAESTTRLQGNPQEAPNNAPRKKAPCPLRNARPDKRRQEEVRRVGEEAHFLAISFPKHPSLKTTSCL